MNKEKRKEETTLIPKIYQERLHAVATYESEEAENITFHIIGTRWLSIKLNLNRFML